MTKASMKLVEAAYRLDVPWDAWLGEMADAALGELDRGCGVIAVAYDARGGGMPQRLGLIARGRAMELLPVLGAIGAEAGSDPMRALLVRGGFASASQVLGIETLSTNAGLMRPGESVGLRDFLQVNAVDPSGVGVLLGAPTREITRASARRTGPWMRVVAHVCAGLRLRLALGTEKAADSAGADAIFTPSGKLEHGTEPAIDAREVLRTAVRARDRARADGQEEALTFWNALVEGRWSLVDHFEADGRRFVVARRNDPNVRDPRGLTDRERQAAGLAALGRSNKAIGYELGLSVSRVGTLVGDAARKLGLKTRGELVAFVRAAIAGPPPP